MSRLHNLEQHRHSLAEIREILNSMKTLAFMESRKLGRFLDAQHAVVTSIEAATEDFLHGYPGVLPGPSGNAVAYVLIGSERGFCGDFNRTLMHRLNKLLREPSPILCVGRKLHGLLLDDPRPSKAIGGASVIEEVPTVLHEVVDELAEIQDTQGGLDVYCLFHEGPNEITLKRLLPPFEYSTPMSVIDPTPPLLNLEPRQVLSGLSEHHVFAALHEMLYASLWSENMSRVTHLEGAVRHLDEQSAKLNRQSNALRQEEIVEEIEVLLLSAHPHVARSRSRGEC